MDKVSLKKDIHNEFKKLQKELTANQEVIANLEYQLVQARSEKDVLHRIAMASSLESLIEEIMLFLRKHWGFDGFVIQFVNSESGFLEFFNMYGELARAGGDGDLVEMAIPLSRQDVLSVRAVTEQRPFFLNRSDISRCNDLSEIDQKLSAAFGYTEWLMVPVVHQGESFAVIQMFSIENSHCLENEDINQIHEFISHLASSLFSEKLKNEIIKTRDEMKKTKDEQQGIIDLVQKINSSIELQELLDFLGSEIERCVEFDGYLINLVDATGEILVCEKLHLPFEFHGIVGTYKKVKFPIKEADPNIDVFKENRSLSFDNETIKSCPGTTMNRFDRWKMSFLTIIPISRGEDKPIGTIMLFRQSDRIDDLTVEKLRYRIGMFYEQLKNAQFYGWLKSQAKEIETATEKYNRLLTAINHISNLNVIDQIYETILEEFMYFFQFDLGTILTKEGEQLVARHTLYLDECFGEAGERFKKWASTNPCPLDISSATSAVAFLNNVHFYFPDLPEIKHLPMSDRDRHGLKLLGDPKTLLIMPIRQGNTPIGVLWLWTLKQCRYYSEEQIALMELLSSFVGTAIANAELYTRVEEQNSEIEKLNSNLEGQNRKLADIARRDRLTDLYNFGFFQEELERRISEYQRAKGHHFLSLVLVDIDYFKRFNDTYGHVAGNIALVDVAKCLKRIARRMDIVCRYGGEEFAVILPKCDIEGARQFAERFREAIENTPVETDNEKVSITVSIGCAGYQPDETQSEFIVRTDEALYRAKENGRNRVEVANQ